MNTHGIALADQIADTIATYNMPPGQRRDSKKNCHRIAFHFRNMDEIYRCQDDILQNFRQAFACSANVVAAGFVRANAPKVSMARTLVIMKLAAREDDIVAFNFFEF